MSIAKQAGWPVIALGLGALLGNLAAHEAPMTAGILSLVLIGLGIAFVLEARRDEWKSEEHDFSRKYLNRFCYGLDQTRADWRNIPAGAFAQAAGQMAAFIYLDMTGPLTPEEKSGLSVAQFHDFDDARGGLVDLCNEWGTRSRTLGFGKFLDGRWKEWWHVITLLAFIEDAKARSLKTPGLVESSGLARIMQHYAPGVIQYVSGYASAPTLGGLPTP